MNQTLTVTCIDISFGISAVYHLLVWSFMHDTYMYAFLPPNKQNFFSCPLVEQKAVLSGEEQERKITTYEEAMNKIKDTTGVSDIKEVVQRFLSQGETQKHLEQLKTNNEKMLVRLKEEKVPFQGLCLLWGRGILKNFSFRLNFLLIFVYLFLCLFIKMLYALTL